LSCGDNCAIEPAEDGARELIGGRHEDGVETLSGGSYASVFICGTT
jgi:hypothetical protein